MSSKKYESQVVVSTAEKLLSFCWGAKMLVGSIYWMDKFMNLEGIAYKPL